MIELREYMDPKGISPFQKWFDSLDARSAAKVNTYVTRVSHGNFGNAKSLGEGVYEIKID